MKQPLLSVITITKNDHIGLSITIDSLKILRNSEIELIIVDGSDQEFASELHPFDFFEFKAIHLIQGPDDGIYDAMNKGLALATGDFVWFLNGGDQNLLANLDFLRGLTSTSVSIILGNYRLGAQISSIHRNASKLSKIRHGLPTSHQAIFYPRSIFQKIGFFLEYKICADYASIAYLYAKGYVFVYVNEEFAQFELGGISGRRTKLLRREARLVQKQILGLSPFHIALSSLRHRITAILRWFFRLF